MDKAAECVTAYMRKDGNEWVTDIRRDGVLYKIIPTPYSQIRPERESLCWASPQAMAALALQLKDTEGRPRR